MSPGWSPLCRSHVSGPHLAVLQLLQVLRPSAPSVLSRFLLFLLGPQFPHLTTPQVPGLKLLAMAVGLLSFCFPSHFPKCVPDVCCVTGPILGSGSSKSLCF